MSDLSHVTITQWLYELDRRGKSQSTQDTYRRGIAHFIRWSEQTYGQSFDPAEIIPRDIEDWVAYQQTVEKAKVNTINSRIVGVSQYFGWALRQKLIKDNPAADVSCLRTSPRQPRALNKTYVRRLLRHIGKSGHVRDIAIAEYLLGAGLRVSELLDLQLGDVTLNKRSGQVVVRRGKGAVHRVVPLTARVRQALQKYLDQDHYLHAYRQDNPQLGDDAPFWIGERGPLTDRSGIFYLLKKYARLAGLDETLISPHVLRHTFASRYLETHRGDLRGLAAILGHATVNTTMIYTEPTTDDLARRMEEADI
ncbi:tyrosine-type recombinase/integrase [Chloroflexota bacterium]